MQCKVCEAKLIEYVYGELDEQDRGRMERHILESEPCREMCRKLESARDAVAIQGEETPPEWLHARIMGHARERKEAGSRRSFRLRLFHPTLAGVAVALIAAIVYVYSIQMGGPFHSRDVPKPVLQGSMKLESAAPEMDQGRAMKVDGRPTSSIMSEAPRQDMRRALEAAPTGVAKDSAGAQVYEEEAWDANEFKKDDPQLPVERIKALTASDRCGEALSWMYIYLAGRPEESEAGRAWLRLARCYKGKGDMKEARDAADHALKIRSSKGEATTLLKEIGDGGDGRASEGTSWR